MKSELYLDFIQRFQVKFSKWSFGDFDFGIPDQRNQVGWSLDSSTYSRKTIRARLLQINNNDNDNN